MTPPLIATYVSSFPPRPCGIATFTRDLSEAVARSGREISTRIAAIGAEASAYAYPPQVRWTIEQNNPQSWVEVARQINASRTSVVSIQHEFGLYGVYGPDGDFDDYLAGFLDELKKPVVTTLHTVLPHPPPHMREAVCRLYERSAAVVTMVNTARLILEEYYGLSSHKVHTIPHGVPHVKHMDPDIAKRGLRLSGRTVLSTFGLLSSGKGIEYMLRAMPAIVEKHPDVLYLVIGETHPEVQRVEGERYRNSLLALVHELGLHHSVQFVNHFLAQEQLVRYLQATDIYVTPYVGRGQITSGTLAYALGCGRAAVSTPYLYAEEVLAECRGLLAEFKDPDSLTRCINMLLDDPGLRRRLERNALEYGQHMSWPVVGARYADLFWEVASGADSSRPVVALPSHTLVPAGTPRVEISNGAVAAAAKSEASLVGSVRNG